MPLRTPAAAAATNAGGPPRPAATRRAAGKAENAPATGGVQTGRLRQPQAAPGPVANAARQGQAGL
eukprot:10305471-Lingulodinium_polyedra.AAC.1